MNKVKRIKVILKEMTHFKDEFSFIEMDELKNKRTNQSFLPFNNEETVFCFIVMKSKNSYNYLHSEEKHY